MVQRFPRNRRPPLRLLAAFGAGIFCACLIGTVTRYGGELATVWPANALLMGWMLRQRRLAGPAGWSVAILAYLAADHLAGASLEMSLHLTAANLACAATGYQLLRRSRRFNRLLLGPESVMTLILAALAAATVSALVALPSMRFVVDDDPAHAFSFWAISELAALFTVLPLTLMAYLPRRGGLSTGTGRPERWLHAAPALSLLGSLLLAMQLGGPGAILFPLPALLWCALVYRPGTAMSLSLVQTLWTLHAIAVGWLPLGALALDLEAVISIRLAVAMMAIAPLLTVAMQASRQRMRQALAHAAHHDDLTGLPSRAGFFARTGEYLGSADLDRGTCVLLVDLDHFKQVNDRHGHAAGDRILADVSHRLRLATPTQAVLGRLGGEEFGILLQDCDLEAATAVAHRVASAINEQPFMLQAGLPPLALSVSVGVAQLREEDSLHIDTLLHRAGQALQRAQSAGRSRVEALD